MCKSKTWYCTAHQQRIKSMAKYNIMVASFHTCQFQCSPILFRCWYQRKRPTCWKIKWFIQFGSCNLFRSNGLGQSFEHSLHQYSICFGNCILYSPFFGFLFDISFLYEENSRNPSIEILSSLCIWVAYHMHTWAMNSHGTR